MKKVFTFFAFLSIAMMAGAQTELQLNEKGEYERKEVVKVDSVSASALYDRAMLALTDWTGPDGKAQAGIDYQSQETHTVVYKGKFYAGARNWMTTRINRYANFTVRVRCKDGRAQVTVNIPTLTATVESTGRTQTWNLGEAFKQVEKTSGKRRERGEEAVNYITSTADNMLAAMTAALRGAGTAGGDDDF